jgi:hypothetical protein
MESTVQTKQKENDPQLAATPYHNKEIESFIESNYISIKDGETRVLQFMSDKTEVIDKTDFNGRPVKKVRFHVIDVNGNSPICKPPIDIVRFLLSYLISFSQ